VNFNIRRSEKCVEIEEFFLAGDKNAFAKKPGTIRETVWPPTEGSPRSTMNRKRD
jgi:hypothetical protein